MSKLGRNEPCHCGSGKKYKTCCLRKDEQARQHEQEERQYEQAVRSGRIDPFAGDDDWEDDPVDDWKEEQEKDWGNEDEHDAADIHSSAPALESRNTPKIERKKLSNEDKANIDAWWTAYRDMSDPDELRGHIENFIASHPDLVGNLGLAEEPLFELEGMYVRQDRHEAYIEILSRICSEFPDAYFKGFAYFDQSMIAWFVMDGQKEKITARLTDFRKYPTDDPDKLFEVVYFLMSWNCQDILADFIPDICNEVCTSPEVIGGGEMLIPMITILMASFLDRGIDDCDPEGLAEEIKTLGSVVNPDWINPDFLKNRMGIILGKYKHWGFDGCNTRRQAMQRYDEMTSNFMGWLNANKGLDWCAAEYHRQLVLNYLGEALPEKKKPREPFPFAEKNMERLLARLTKKIMWLDSTRLFGMLNGLYWFMEFLEETLSFDQEQTRLGREACTHLFKRVYPAQRKQDFIARAWEQFPVEM